jgi:hypothetical protein
MLAHLGKGHHVEVAAGRERFGILWARTETGDAVARLSQFRPRPTLVLRDGATVQKTALWALTQPLDMALAERANKRLAYRLKCPHKHAMPKGYAFRPPGCEIRNGRRVPVVVVEFNPDATYTAGQVVGRDRPDRGLPDPPKPRPRRRP